MGSTAAFLPNIRHYSLELSPLCGTFQGRKSEGLEERDVDDMQQHFWATFKTRTSHLHGALYASSNRHKLCFINKKRQESNNISGSYWELFNIMQKFSRCNLLFDTQNMFLEAFSMQGGAALYLLVFLTVWVRCHANPSLGIIQAATSDIWRRRARDHVKKAAAVRRGNSLRNMREAAWKEEEEKEKDEGWKKTKGQSAEHSGMEVN